MKSSLLIVIQPDGTIRTIAHESLALDNLGTTEKLRASHVWPCHPLKRFAFRVLRSAFGERGRVASWCRSWHGPWEVRFARQPHRVVFSHPSRRVCIDWEIHQLNQQLRHE